MAWAIQFDGVNDYGIPVNAVVIPWSTPFEIEVKVTVTGNYSRPFGNQAGNFSRLLIFDTTNEVRLTTDTGYNVKFTAPAYVKTDFNTFKFISDGLGISFYFNGAFVETKSGYTGGFNINRVGRHSTVGYTKGAIEFIRINSNSVDLVNWDATASDHSAVTPVLSDTVGINDVTMVKMPTDGSAWLDLGGEFLVINATLSLTNNSTLTLKSQKLSSAILSSAALNTSILNSSKQISAKVSTDSVSTINMSCFKQAYGSLQLSNIVVVTLNGQKIIADTRSAILLLTNQTIVTLKTQKLARSQLSLPTATNLNVYGQKNAASSLTTTSLSTITINGSKISIDSRNAILSLSNSTFVTIKAHKQNTASVNLSNATNVIIVAQKSASAALHLQNYATTKITKYSDSYIPVVRRLCIQAQLIRLSIPANINNKLIIQGCF
jgi:hypothetical protein